MDLDQAMIWTVKIRDPDSIPLIWEIYFHMQVVEEELTFAVDLESNIDLDSWNLWGLPNSAELDISFFLARSISETPDTVDLLPAAYSMVDTLYALTPFHRS